MNKNLLRSIMVLHDETNEILAAHLDISKQSLSNKMNENGQEFTQSEIARIRAKYNLSDAQVVAIFFAD